ncbi:MAG: hypothetical protein ACJAWN_000544, partial [Neolewinella sp.]
MTLRKLSLLLILLICTCTFGSALKASTILIPMDDKQTDHLKAYGICYWVLDNQIDAW